MLTFAFVMVRRMLFSKSNSEPLFKQLMNYIVNQIGAGEYPSDKPLPSLNAMAIKTGLSKETVVKAYSRLLKEGVINSMPGKGYFVREGFLSGKPSLFVLMDKLSPHQQSIMDGLVEVLAGYADITIRMHYQDLLQFESELDKALGRYDWYLVFPHFDINSHTQAKAASLLKCVPSEKLIVLDRLIAGVSDEAGASYQSIERDIPETLIMAMDDIKSYRRFRYISLSVSLYGDLVAETVSRFCEEHSIPVEVLKEVPDEILEKDLFFVSGSRLDRKLSALIKSMTETGLTIGKDIGLICYNDFPLNEFILGGLTTLSTDFEQMGRAAAEMILSGHLAKVHIPCSLIRRNTF